MSTNIVEHGVYTMKRAAFVRQDLVDAYLEELDDESDEAHGLSLEDFNLESESSGKHDKEQGDRGHASNIVTVKFGDGESAFEIASASKAEGGKIQLAYVGTSNKIKGGKEPFVFVFVNFIDRASSEERGCKNV